jgi:urate oxidase
MRGSGEVRTTSVTRAQNAEFVVHSGLDNMVLLKTAKSGFEGYIKDSLTTLKETSDRLFGTAVRAEWHYTASDLDFDLARLTIRETMLRTFANHDSKSVQQTLYAMAQSALEEVPQIDEIEITMPNKHCLLVDLSRFGQDNPNEIFVPTDEPFGYIEARVRRKV